jgi:hydrogenase/urease accessory protein HupE
MSIARRRALTLVVLAAGLAGLPELAPVAYGHALQPGYMEVQRVDDDLYSVLWKIPSSKSRPMAISAVLPENCDQRSSSQAVWDGMAFLARWSTRCTDGLEGGEIRIEGLDQTSTDVLVRFDFADGTAESRRLTPEESSFTIPAIPSRLEVVRTYLVLGFRHILDGIDHLMFVLALLILVNGARRLVVTVTAFTLAHSFTLVGATVGLIRVPAPPVEAAIALSIMFVASEIMHSRAGKPGLTEQYPWVVAFIFGLLHGLGFAGALAQIGLPKASIPPALLFFNVGVEFGQLFFIGCVFLVMGAGRSLVHRINMPRLAWASAVPPYVIGSAAAFWTLQRLAEF